MPSNGNFSSFLFQLGLFCSYIGLWAVVSVLVHVSQRIGQPAYNPSTAVLFTEVVKLGLSIGFYLARDGSTTDLVKSVRATSRTLAMYIVPGALYCVYNNLIFYNLSILDPGTYSVLMQLRIVATAALHSAVFSIRLRGLQWFALLLICAGALLAIDSPQPLLVPPLASALCWLRPGKLSDVVMCSLAQALFSRRPRNSEASRTTTRHLPQRWSCSRPHTAPPHEAACTLSCCCRSCVLHLLVYTRNDC